ncbi:30S ribosomal protein S27ae [Candidatus Woesearchaeota archaeon]|nr:30S ribosomal protein S27ae [Candidatus Woesearchaeota archaeon]
MAKEKKEKKKIKKPRHSLYKEGKTENQSCPKCGSGYLLAEHSNRRVCGKCRYMETKSK